MRTFKKLEKTLKERVAILKKVTHKRFSSSVLKPYEKYI